MNTWSMAQRDAVVREIAQRARVEQARVTPEAHLVVDLGLSSLDLLSVLAFVEQTCGARFPDALLPTLVTLEAIGLAVSTHRPHAAEYA